MTLFVCMVFPSRVACLFEIPVSRVQVGQASCAQFGLIQFSGEGCKNWVHDVFFNFGWVGDGKSDGE